LIQIKLASWTGAIPAIASSGNSSVSAAKAFGTIEAGYWPQRLWPNFPQGMPTVEIRCGAQHF
jgi:hypothetical protein